MSKKDFKKRASEFYVKLQELQQEYQCYFFISPSEVNMESGVVDMQGAFDFIPVSELDIIG